ncbi:aspartate aminotransferase family protein [Natribacillus halophilus]|uniref:Glutamate-1-semialdehyde 2,1-aminomutase n=1 Tax=Natribacillus halophilus TaxID=549003 RepID=A0A1G8LIJ7_9BACI|nr:aspartate aminotransferase family protein [Natribacillus halophilus]SDI55552.1 glutamate-1-semialdehyde 2,1-aminomutase [Natribacillus halophilus]
MTIPKVVHPDEVYTERTTESLAHMERAREVMPGGMTANIKHFTPYPLAIQRAEGCRFYDMDGNEYIDYLMGYGSLILGHGHPHVREAMMRQIEEDGTWLFGTPHEREVTMARRIQKYFPSMEQIRYANSGTEANLLATRLAMARTGKYKIAKFEGHYHGAIDSLLVSVHPPQTDAGFHEGPHAVPDSGGMSSEVVDNAIILPFNDAKSCARILEQHKDELAAVIIEPMEGGVIAPKSHFLQKLRQITEKLGILLIFDEVKTAFRTAMEGVQGIYNVTPDLTTIGKVVGGGFPFGVVGGKAEIMERSSPLRGSDIFAGESSPEQQPCEKALFHSGTYNGHPLILAAGLATLDILESEFESLVMRTDRFREELSRIFKKHGIPMKTVGSGAMFSVLLTERNEINHYRDMQACDHDSRKKLDKSLFEAGVYTKPGNRYSLSVAHDDQALMQTLQAYDRVVPEALL